MDSILLCACQQNHQRWTSIDAQSRIDSAARAFGALSKCIFRSQNIDRKAKRKSAIYESLILSSIYLYMGAKVGASPEGRTPSFANSTLDLLELRVTTNCNSITDVYQSPQGKLRPNLVWTRWTNTWPAVNCDGLDMAAACPLIVCPTFALFLASLQETKGCPGDDLR